MQADPPLVTGVAPPAGTAPALVLASASRYRAAQLARLGLPFDVDAADIDESARPGERPAALVARLAVEKARTVLARRPGTVVIGSDQVAVLDGHRLGKPGSAARARAQLARQSGRSVDFLTAVHVADGRRGASPAPAAVDAADGEAIDGAVTEDAEGTDADTAVDVTRVVVRRLSTAEIARYVAADRPLDCAGAFRVEALGIVLFERVRSEDPTALVGLPLVATARLLRRCGFALP